MSRSTRDTCPTCANSGRIQQDELDMPCPDGCEAALQSVLRKLRRHRTTIGQEMNEAGASIVCPHSDHLGRPIYASN